MTLLSPEKLPRPIRRIVPYVPLLVFVTIAVLLAGISFQTFRQIETLIVSDKLHDLGAIADLRVKQIGAWQKTQIRQGESFRNGNFLSDEFDRWLRQGAPSDMRKQRIQEMLDGILRLEAYQDISLFDSQGLVRISTAGGQRRDTKDAALAMEAMRSRKVAMSDIHASEDNAGEIRIDLVAPLVVVDGNGGQVVGAVIFRIDPRQFLYPLLQEWPTPSPSAETALVRRDGDDILFLNELRHLKGSALSLRIPLAAFTLPAALAALGKASAMDGFDYRGVAVVSEMRKVPGTNWFVVSKIDKDELLAPVIRLEQWSLSLGLAFTLLGGILLFVWLKANHTRHKFLKEQHAAAVEREMLLKHFEYLTKYASDVIFVADASGRIIEANERAMEVYGYMREEFLHMQVRDFRDPAEDPAVVKEQTERLTELGELRYQSVNRRKDGTTLCVEVSARYIEVQGAKYMQAIIRDITDRKLFEEMRTEIERIGRINIVGEMTSILAHELSQPLSAASIYLDGCLNRMAENDWDREKLRNAVRQAHAQTQRAGRIISHLKELMRKQGRQRDMTDINLVIKDSVNFLQQELNRHSVALTLNFSDLPLTSVNRIEIRVNLSSL